MILAMIGMIGGILCAAADFLWDLKGAENKKLGEKKLIYSAWKNMPEWRFILSAVLCVFAIPMYCLGVFSLADQISEHNAVLGNVMWYSTFLGGCCGIVTHLSACAKPMIYKRLGCDAELTEKVIISMRKVFALPFYLPFLLFVFVDFIVLAIAFASGCLTAPEWLLVFTPIGIMAVSLILRKINYRLFCDVPYVGGISLGMAGYSLIALVDLVLAA